MIIINTGLIGKSAEFNNVLNAANIIAATDVTTLILGESGTGKELIAQDIHHKSPRADKPFITINCAALPENLIESELFGHKKGAFTGADSSREGRIRAAHGGTLFLDEIGELPLSIQAKFLRFLESGECQVLGEEKTTMVDVRVIAATNRNLLNEVNQGNFRADLYYRLNIIPIVLPPLRERSDDVAPLLNHYIKKTSTNYNLPMISFDKECLSYLKKYSWPGNIRELKNFIERMSILFSGQQITLNQLPIEMRHSTKEAVGSTDFNLPETGINLEQIEVGLINQALNKTSGNRSRAARLLGLTRDTLLYRMKKHSIA